MTVQCFADMRILVRSNFATRLFEVRTHVCISAPLAIAGAHHGSPSREGDFCQVESVYKPGFYLMGPTPVLRFGAANQKQD